MLGRPHESILAAGPVQPCTASAPSKRSCASSALPASGCGGHAGTTRPGAGRTGGCDGPPPPGRRQRGPAFHVGQHLPVAERLAGGPGHARRGVRPACAPPPPGRPRPWRRTGRRSAGRPRRAGATTRPRRAAGRVGLEPGSVVGEGPAGAERDLQGADAPAPVRGLHARRPPPGRARRAGRAGPPSRPFLVELGLERGGDVGVTGRDGEVVDHGPQVQPGAPDEQRVMPSSPDAGQRLPGRRLVLGDREVLLGVDQVDEVVGHRRPLGARFRRPDVHAPIDAHGVDRDDFAVSPAPGQLQRGLRLARGGDPDQCDLVKRPPPGCALDAGAAPSPPPDARRGDGGGRPSPQPGQGAGGGCAGGSPDGKVHQLPLAGATVQHRLVATAHTLHEHLLATADAGRWRASAERSITVLRRSKRSATTSGGTKSDSMAAARVPGRGEKMKVNALS